MRKISYWRVLAAAIVYTIVAQIIHTIGAFLEMGYYSMPEYFPVWSKIMMPTAGPPPMSFYVYSLSFGFVSALMFALVYAFIKRGLPNKSRLNRGLTFGVLVFMVAGIPGYLAMYLLINLPAMLLVSWTVQSLVIYLLMGVITAYIIK